MTDVSPSATGLPEWDVADRMRKALRCADMATSRYTQDLNALGVLTRQGAPTEAGAPIAVLGDFPLMTPERSGDLVTRKSRWITTVRMSASWPQGRLRNRADDSTARDVVYRPD